MIDQWSGACYSCGVYSACHVSWRSARHCSSCIVYRPACHACLLYVINMFVPARVSVFVLVMRCDESDSVVRGRLQQGQGTISDAACPEVWCRICHCHCSMWRTMVAPHARHMARQAAAPEQAAALCALDERCACPHAHRARALLDMLHERVSLVRDEQCGLPGCPGRFPACFTCHLA
jgi:hypothetical protein